MNKTQSAKYIHALLSLSHLTVSQGNTIILVTHEEEIACYSHRIVRFRDGVVERDEPVSPDQRA